MRLHVGEGAVEELLGAVDGELLGLVDEFAAAVIALARIALGVFVGEHRALRLQHRARDDVLRGDQLDLVLLALQLAVDRAGQLGIGFGEQGCEEAVWRERPGVLRAVMTFGFAFLGHDNLATRRAWRPPSKGGRRKVLRQSLAVSAPIMPPAQRQHIGVVVLAREPRGRCRRGTSAARTARWRLAAIDMPIPVPQISKPNRALPASTAAATFSAKSG